MKNENTPENWGRDHWSTFAYLETIAVENNGIAIPNIDKMRTNKKHSILLGKRYTKDYPTILKEGNIPNHDNWDCVDDLIEHGFLVNESNDKRFAYSLTPKGRTTINALREHKCNGGSLQKFNFE